MIYFVAIRAGMSGIACATVLHAAGQSVRLIDKGRRIEVRMATRREAIAFNIIRFDHGAQSLDQSQDANKLKNLDILLISSNNYSYIFLHD